MFSGIIKHTGKISKIYKNTNNCTIEILSKIKFSKFEIGSSVSCSGTCLTLEKYKRNLSKFYISKETLNRTNFKSSNKGDLINLEKSLKFGDNISGHFVQGHVDTTSVVQKIDFVGKSWLIHFKLIKKYKKYVFGNIGFNVLYAFFSTLSFVALIPMMNVLFDKSEVVKAEPVWTGLGDTKNYLEQLLNYNKLILTTNEFQKSESYL